MDEPPELAARAWLCPVVQRRAAAHRQHGRAMIATLQHNNKIAVVNNTTFIVKPVVT